MKNDISVKFINRTAFIIYPLAVFLLTFAETVQGQYSRTINDGYTPTAVAPGAPAGSYALSQFDNHNLYNGNLNFRLPLVQGGGRGSAGYTITLPVEAHWQIYRYYTGPSDFSPDVMYEPVGSAGYGPGYMFGRYAASDAITSANCSSHQELVSLLTRLTFVTPDGTEHQLHDKAYQGAAHTVDYCDSPIPTRNRGKIFVTADGESLTFISDNDISDSAIAVYSEYFQPAGNLLTRDGTLYRIDGGLVQWIRDRNGNRVNFSYGSPYNRVTSITDSLNRQIFITYSTTIDSYDEISFKGFGSAPRSIKIWRSYLHNALRQGSAIQKGYELFPEIYNFNPTYTGDWDHDPGVISKVELPDNRTYQFYYNSFGELARVILPTGGGFDYDFPGPGNSGYAAMIYRRLSGRKVYKTLTPTTDPFNPPAGTLEKKESFSVAPDATLPSSISVTVQHKDASDFLLSQDVHYFYGRPTDEGNLCPPIEYSPWYAGREFKSESYNVSNGTLGAALRIIEQIWSPTLPSTAIICGCSSPPPNPKITETVTTRVDSNQVAKQSSIHPVTGAIGFDQYSNQTDIYEYD